MSNVFLISGTILGQAGQPVRGVLVQAVAETLVSETPDLCIGKVAVTNADGKYFIRLQSSDFAAAEVDILDTKIQLGVIYSDGEAMAETVSRFGSPKLLTRDRQISIDALPDAPVSAKIDLSPSERTGTLSALMTALAEDEDRVFTFQLFNGLLVSELSARICTYLKEVAPSALALIEPALAGTDIRTVASDAIVDIVDRLFLDASAVIEGIDTSIRKVIEDISSSRISLSVGDELGWTDSSEGHPALADFISAVVSEPASFAVVKAAAGLSNETYALLKQAALNLEYPSAELLDILVDQEQITSAERKAIRLSAGLREFLGDNADLIAATLDANPSITAPIDLAVKRQTYWKDMLDADDGALLPAGKTAAAFASEIVAAFEKRYAREVVLHRAFVADKSSTVDLLTTELAGEIASSFQYIHGRKVVTVPSESGGGDEEMRTTGTPTPLMTMASMLNSYRHLGLAEVATDEESTIAERKAEIHNRLNALSTFYANNGAEGLLSTRILTDDTEGIDWTGVDENFKSNIRKQVMSVQRTFALGGSPSTVDSLTHAGLDSALDITRLGKTDFKASVDLEDDEADRVYANAERMAFATLNLIESYRVILSSDREHTNVESADRRVAYKNLLKDMDGYSDLFGAQNACDADDCQTVLSPAAYFVDLMRFVDEHFTPLLEGKSYETHPLADFISLYARRPDLWSLPLNCENTKELIPYLNIVVEVLEGYLPNVFTSLGSPSMEAYEYLATGADSFGSPTSIPNRELQLYLEHFKSNPHEVFTTIAPARETSEKAWRLSLGLTQNEFTRLTTSQGVGVCKFFGKKPANGGTYPTATYENGGMAEYPMAAFLKRTKITRDEFFQLVAVTSIPNSDLTCPPLDNPLVSVEEFIYGLENPLLAENVYRWIRLSRATSLSIPDLDIILNSFASVGIIDSDDPQFSAAILLALAQALHIRNRLTLSVEETAAMIGYMPHSSNWDQARDMGKDAPLCDRLFRTEKLFGLAGAASLNINAVGFPQTSYIMSALGLSEGELFTLLKYMGQDLKAVTPAETAPVAQKRVLRIFTHLFRYAVLSRKLEIPIASLLPLLRCIGYTNLFGTSMPSTAPAALANMDALVSVLDSMDEVRTSSITIPDASYVLMNVTDSTHPVSCTIEDARQVFKAATAKRGTGEVRLKNALADAIGVSFLQIGYLLAFCPQGVHLSQVGAKLPPPPPLLPEESESAGGDEVGRIMDPEKDQYKLSGHLGPDTDDEPIAYRRREEYIEPEGEGVTWYDLHETTTGVMPRTPTGTVQVVLESGVSFTALQDLQKAKERLRAIMEELYTFQWFCKKLRINTDDLAAIAENKEAFGLSDVADLRYQDLVRIERFKKYFDGKIELFNNLCKAASKTGADREAFYIQPLSELLQKDQMLVSTSDALLSVSGAFSGGLMFRISAVERIVSLAEKLGVSAGVLLSVLAKDDAHSDIIEARDTALELFKAKYPDETRRAAVLGAYATRILTWKRDAICEYILNWADSDLLNLNTTDDIYAHLLLDVDVTEAVLTSRLVCAISSIQLYVQRCLLFLETMDDGIGITPQQAHQFKKWNTASQEWEWRKNYRVWEANRKVFLYPENFLEPDLRDDKTPLFKAFEDAVAQQKVSEDTAEAAYMDYMHGLSQLGNMVYIGAYKTGDKTDPTGTYYLMAKSGGDPKKLYYRTLTVGDLKNRGDWGPWLEIPATADPIQMSAIEYRRDIFFFWMTLVEKRQTELGSDGGSGKTTVSYTKTLHWISYNTATKKWTQEQKQDIVQEDLGSDPDSIDWYEQYIKPDLYVYPVLSGSGLYIMHYGQQHRPIWKTLSKDSRIDVGDMNGITMKYDLYSNAFHRVWISNHNGWYYNNVTRASEADPGQPELSDNPEFYMSSGISLFKASSLAFDIEGEKKMVGGDDPSSGGVYMFVGSLSVIRDQPTTLYRFTSSPTFGEALFASIDFDKYIRSYTRYQIGMPPPFEKYGPFTSSLPDLDILHSGPGNNPESYHNAVRKFLTQNQVLDYGNGRATLQEMDSYVSGKKALLPKAALQVQNTNGSTLDKPWMLPTGNFSLGNIFYCNGNFYLICLNEDPTKRYFLRLNSPSMGSLENEIGQGLVNFLTLGTQIRAAAPGFDPAIQPADGSIWFTRPALIPVSGTNPPVKRLDTLYTDHLDFGGSYGNYFQELFLHMPWYLGSRLNAEGKYKEAKDWYEKIFDPTKKESLLQGATGQGTLSQSPEQNWIYMPFRDMYAVDGEAFQSLYQQILTDTLGKIAYRESPFSPYAIARNRPTAMAKSVVMRYIDNLLDWADSLFARDTTESVNEAMMLYILANQILGDRPYSTGPCRLADADYVTYETIDAVSESDGFFYTIESDLALEAGGALSAISGGNGVGTAYGVALGIFNDSGMRTGSGADRRAVFGIPKNLEFYEYWDRVADRLFKIRNSMNIDGVRRQLALFAPPIDPRMLIRLRAAGMTLDDAVSINIQLSPYRFSFMLEKAKQYTQTVQSFGGALLSALEKKDAEELQLLRSVHEQNLLQLTLDVKKKQVEVAQNQLDALLESKANVEQRRDYYGSLIENGLTGWERTQQVSKHLATRWRYNENALLLGAAAAHQLPDLGSPFAFLFGGTNIGQSLRSLSASFGVLSTVANEISSSAGLEATFQRRAEEWKQQKRTAEQELKQMEKQILASEVQLHIAEQELVIHQKNMDQTDELELLYKDKFTNLGLYTYLATKLQKLYREAYGMAAKMAYDAQRSYAFECDEDERKDSYILPDNFSTERIGLLAGEALMLQLQQMEMAYLGGNKRTLEVNQTFSLASLFPSGLLELQETGKCEFVIPEEAFDLLYPGQYKRLIKGVRVTIPCVVGPYMNVPLVLRMVGSYIRKDPGTFKNEGDSGHQTPLFTTALGTTSIAISQGQYDSGMFEFNFRDERYLPFENAGAVSRWSLELPTELPPFDYTTISDVLLHVSYTAKEDTSAEDNLRIRVNNRIRKLLKDQIIGYLHPTDASSNQTKGLYRLISLKECFPDAYHELSLSHSTQIHVTEKFFPAFLRGENLILNSVSLLVKEKDGTTSATAYDAGISGGFIHAVDINHPAPDWEYLTDRIAQLTYEYFNGSVSPDNTYTVNAQNSVLSVADDILLLIRYTVAA
ncbi:neuraminidase-like domain-containing protein [Nostoc sp. NIES-2111]